MSETKQARKDRQERDQASGRLRERAFLKNAKPGGYTWPLTKLTPMERTLLASLDRLAGAADGAGK